jgi:hypothetical protein
VKGKGKGKGKSSSNKRLQDQINAEAEKRLQGFLEEQRQTRSSIDKPLSLDRRDIQSTSRAFSQQRAATSQDHSDNPRYAQSSTSDWMTEDLRSVTATTRNIFIRRIDCLLNANPIDQIEDKQTG